MGELPAEDTTTPEPEVLGADDSPLARALRRRKQEIDSREPVTAGYDAVI